MPRPVEKKNTKKKWLQPPKKGGAGPIVRDHKEAVSKGQSAARRARGDHPR